MKKILVLMSSYNGELYIREQIESILNQKGVDVHLLVRDDASKDNTVKIVEQFVGEKVELIKGENLGYAKSFWTLLKDCKKEYDYYAFADQDDIWLEDKLVSAINMIEKEGDIPCLYTSNVIAVNNNREVIKEYFFDHRLALNFYQSLQKSILPGCTFVFNKKAIMLAAQYDGFMESHDWALYAITSAFGKVLYDDTLHMNYRIHGNNVIGKDSRWKLFKRRMKRLFAKPNCARSRFAKDFYECYQEQFSNQEYENAAFLLGFYKIKHKRLKLFFSKKFKGLAFRVYVLLGRV